MKKKFKFDTYNDGVIEFGEYIEAYGVDGNALDNKEFIKEGKLCFSYQFIREQDKLKFDNTGVQISIKIKTRYLKTVNTSKVIRLNENLYSIVKLDPDNKNENMYIYLTELVDDMDKHISILKRKDNGVLKDDMFELYKTVWGKICSSDSEKEKGIGEKLDSIQIKVVTIRYIEELTFKNATNDLLIEYEKNKYNIVKIINVKEESKLLEINMEMI